MAPAAPTVSIAQYASAVYGQAIQLGTYGPILGRMGRVLQDLTRLPATGVDRPPPEFNRHKDRLRATLRKVFEEHERPDYLPQPPIGLSGGWPADWADLRITPGGLSILTNAERRQKPLNEERVRTLLALEGAPEELFPLFPDSLHDRFQTNPFAKDPIRQSLFAPTKEGVRQTAAIRAFTGAIGPRSFHEYVMGGRSWRDDIGLLGYHLQHQGFDLSRQENETGSSVSIRISKQPASEILLTQERPGNLGTELAAKAMLFGLLGSTLGEGWLGVHQFLTGGMQIAGLEIKILGEPRQTTQPPGRNVAFVVSTSIGDLAATISLKKIADRLFPTGRFEETDLPTEQQWFEACLRAMTVSLHVYTQGEKGGMPLALTEGETIKLFDSTLPWTALYTAQTFVDSLRGWAVRNRGYPL